METLEIARTEKILSDDMFQRLAAIPLIDRYEAYQLLDDQWQGFPLTLRLSRRKDLRRQSR